MSGGAFERLEPRFAFAAVCGVVDQLTSDGRLKGWAFDPDTPSSQVAVHLYVQNRFVGHAVTTESRTDVNSVFGITGTHGFTVVIPEKFPDDETPLLNGVSRDWILYGINSSGENDNRPIGASTPQNRGDLNCGLPQGTTRPVSDLDPIKIAVPQVQVSPDHDIISGTITDADVPGQSIPYAISLLGGPVFTGQTDGSGYFKIVVPPVLNLGTSSTVRVVVSNQGTTGRNIDSTPAIYHWPFANFPSTAEASPFFRSDFPSDLRDDKLLTSNRVFYYKEQENYFLPGTSPLTLSAAGVGNYIAPGTHFFEMQNLRPGSPYPAQFDISAGTKIDSYYVHFDPSEPTDSRQRLTYTSGSITFPNRIMGIISEQAHLDASNVRVGRSSTTYGGHGLEIRVPEDAGDSLDSVRILSDGRTLRYAFRARGLDAFRVITEPANVAPSFMGPLVFTMVENSVNAGQALAVDPDNGPSPLTYSLDTANLDGALFRINSSGMLSFLSPPNFENPQDQDHDNDYQVNVSVSDGSATITNRFRVLVSNINESPSQLVISKNDVPENQSPGTIVGLFTTVDPDLANTFVYSLVNGAGSEDNLRFIIDSATGLLKTAASFDFETKSSYSIRVRSTDQGGLAFEKSLEIIVSNVVELLRPVQIGDGSSQRSMIRQVVLDFDSSIAFEPGAFLVRQRRNDAGVISFVDVTTQPMLSSLANGASRVTLTFSGALTFGGGALVDGNYQLTVDGSKVKSLANNSLFDGDADGSAGGNFVYGAQLADEFFALFGDTNGDGVVGIEEFGQFRLAFGRTISQTGYNSLFDYEGDGVIGVSDFGQFRSRFGKSRMPF